MPAALEFFTELGLSFTSILFEDVGLRVMLDWNGGLELVGLPVTMLSTDIPET